MDKPDSVKDLVRILQILSLRLSQGRATELERLAWQLGVSEIALAVNDLLLKDLDLDAFTATGILGYMYNEALAAASGNGAIGVLMREQVTKEVAKMNNFENNGSRLQEIVKKLNLH